MKKCTYDAGEGNKMVLAQGRDGDVLDDDKFLVIFGEYGIVDDIYAARVRSGLISHRY